MADLETASENVPPRAAPTPLGELAGLFFRLGATAFGGPAAHIAMMRDEVVTRRRWLTDAEFLDLLGATNLIPGPNSTEMAIHVGWARRRWAGLVVAGVSFIVPAMLLTAALGWAYLRYGALPQATWLLDGVKPVMVAVVVQAIWTMVPKAATTLPLRLLGAACLVGAFASVNELLLLLAGGVIHALGSPRISAKSALFVVLPIAAPAARAPFDLSSLFWIFCKIGSVLFGSGYVLLAFLRADLVERLHWLSEAQLLDAIAAGQLTPGPVFTTATFIGYLLSGPMGALVATAGIFLPAFVFVAASGPLVPRVRRSPAAGRFLDGVNVASLALMASVTWQLGRAAIVDAPTALIAAATAVLLVRFKVSSTWLVLAGGAVGWLLHLGR